MSWHATSCSVVGALNVYVWINIILLVVLLEEKVLGKDGAWLGKVVLEGKKNEEKDAEDVTVWWEWDGDLGENVLSLEIGDGVTLREDVYLWMG